MINRLEHRQEIIRRLDCLSFAEPNFVGHVISRYSEGFFENKRLVDKISWVSYRILNAIKFLWMQSDWQRVRRTFSHSIGVIANDEKKILYDLMKHFSDLKYAPLQRGEDSSFFSQIINKQPLARRIDSKRLFQFYYCLECKDRRKYEESVKKLLHGGEGVLQAFAEMNFIQEDLERLFLYSEGERKDIKDLIIELTRSFSIPNLQYLTDSFLWHIFHEGIEENEGTFERTSRYIMGIKKEYEKKRGRALNFEEAHSDFLYPPQMGLKKIAVRCLKEYGSYEEIPVKAKFQFAIRPNIGEEDPEYQTGFCEIDLSFLRLHDKKQMREAWVLLRDMLNSESPEEIESSFPNFHRMLDVAERFRLEQDLELKRTLFYLDDLE